MSDFTEQFHLPWDHDLEWAEKRLLDGVREIDIDATQSQVGPREGDLLRILSVLHRVAKTVRQLQEATKQPGVY